jgi:hypothetical protein
VAADCCRSVVRPSRLARGRLRSDGEGRAGSHLRMRTVGAAPPIQRRPQHPRRQATLIRRRPARPTALILRCEPAGDRQACAPLRRASLEGRTTTLRLPARAGHCPDGPHPEVRARKWVDRHAPASPGEPRRTHRGASASGSGRPLLPPPLILRCEPAGGRQACAPLRRASLEGRTAAPRPRRHGRRPTLTASPYSRPASSRSRT